MLDNDYCFLGFPNKEIEDDSRKERTADVSCARHKVRFFCSGYLIALGAILFFVILHTLFMQ
jgi:hypothetical protein